MSRHATFDLDKLARGETIDRAAFLALLRDPEARQDLEQIATVRAVVDGTGVDSEASQGMAMDVSWEELARHAEGSLADESRQQAVDRFLNEHFPEAPGANPWEDTTVMEMSDTVVAP